MPTAPAAAVAALANPHPPPATLPTPTPPHNRDAVLHLARESTPWAFLSAALPALRQQPDDHELRFLVAAAFAKLMLVTPAREHLAVLPKSMSQAAAALAAAIARLPDDRISSASLTDTCRGNLDALRERAIDPLDFNTHFAAWKGRASTWDWFRTRDGNIVRRVATPHHARPEHDDWLLLQDIKTPVAALALPHLARSAPPPAGAIRPYVLEGIDPPWLVERVLRETPAAADGYHPRITIVQEDPLELLDGLAQTDLRDVLVRSRVNVIIGPDAADKLASSLAAAMDTQIAGPGLSMSTVRTKIRPSVEAVMQSAQRAQMAEQQRLIARVEQTYGDRNRDWWARRFERALASEVDSREPGTAGGTNPPLNHLPLRGGTESLRVLIPTCRYSTYIKHASADLAHAFEQIGCRARLVIEPDDASQLAALSYLRAVADFQPDLVILINYSRANINGTIGRSRASPDAVPPSVIHPNIPYIMWVQDAMPHQLDKRVGEAMGELDFVAGNLRSELFLRFAYPRDRALDFPIVASSVKFHTGPVSADLRERHTCEVAYVSHHSETPAAMHARKRREASADATLVALVDLLRPHVECETLRTSPEPLSLRLRASAREVLTATGGGANDPRLVEQLMQLYLMPLADRLLRHQTLEWAADIADRRDWRLHLYGRGWNTHPTFARFARGELPHGDDLRASYQCAAAHLQVSAHSIIHQRIFECVLAGGTPIARISEDDLSSLEYAASLNAAKSALASGHTHDASDPWRLIPLNRRYFGYRVERAPGGEGTRYAALRERLGLPEHARSNNRALIWINSAHVERLASPTGFDTDGIPVSVLPEERSLFWLFDEPAECVFADRQGLEAALARAVSGAARGDARSANTRWRVRLHLTHEVLARRFLALVRDSLAAAPTVPAHTLR